MPYIQSCLFRREVFEICGGLDETMTLGEDHDLMYRCWENDIVKINVDEVSFIYRRHSTNVSRGKNLQSHLYGDEAARGSNSIGTGGPVSEAALRFSRIYRPHRRGQPVDSLVSVVIPAHNSQRYIVATLDSILAQRHRPLEILVVDDGSTDSTAQIVREYAPEVRLIEQDQRGHPAARNTGIRAATGEYLAFLDHDDLWSPDKLERQMACFDRNPGARFSLRAYPEFFHSGNAARGARATGRPASAPAGIVAGRHAGATPVVRSRRALFRRAQHR